MTVIARSTIRTALKALLDATTKWQATYTSQPKSFGGLSPVATLHDGPLDWELLAAGYTPDVYKAEIWLTNYVRRGPDDDTDTAETALDTLFAAVAGVVAASRKTTNWTLVDMASPTEPDYSMVDGVQYRSERIRLVFTLRN
ncbi:MAG: hypothetical protein JXR84_04170 [Anaerolineae bacterium]|nr:hypothetical protein [Anaerolineae bacterium]